MADEDRLVRVLLDVTLEVKFSALGQEILAALAATTAKDVAAGLGGHAGAESMLKLARALGWLKGAFHDRES